MRTLGTETRSPERAANALFIVTYLKLQGNYIISPFPFAPANPPRALSFLSSLKFVVSITLLLYTHIFRYRFLNYRNALLRL